MSQEYDNNNRGVLFVNTKKAEGSKQPDRTGSLNVDGVEYFLDGWLKKSQSGQPFMSVSIKRKDKQPEQQQAQRTASAPAPRQTPPQATPANTGGFEDMDSDIPFANPMRGSVRCLAM